MKLKYTFEPVEMDEEIIFVPVGEGASQVRGVLKMNAEAREIVEMLKKETTETAIVDALHAKYENDIETLTFYVTRVVNNLRSAGILAD